MLCMSAPAKVNLSLAVHRRRPDGYHDISTLFLKISLADEVCLTAQPHDITVHCVHPDVPNDARNLVYRAAAMLQPLAPGQGVQIALQEDHPGRCRVGRRQQ